MGSTEQHYSLRWNDYTVKIVTAFQSLRDEEDFVDVTVACDGHHYSAHKMVLSACSPYFRSLLRANPCQHPIVILKDVGHIEMERLLEFMYNGEVNIAQDQLAAFLKTAENLKIRGLAGSSEDMDQLQNKDNLHNFSNTSGANNSGGVSGKTSPVGNFVTNMVSKEEDANIESPPSKRRRRTNGPATSLSDTNATSHSTDGNLVSDNGDMDGPSVGTNTLGSIDEDLRMIDRREMKPEPADSLVDVYNDTSELGSDVQDQMDHRPVMYPLGIAGPSGVPSVGSQESLSQEPGAPGSAACEALNLSVRSSSSMNHSNGLVHPASPLSLHRRHHHHHLTHPMNSTPVTSVATTVISHVGCVLDTCEDMDKKTQQFIELVYPDARFGLGAPHSEKMGAIEIIDPGSVSGNTQILDRVALSNTSNHEFKSKTYPCQECHKVFRHPMSLHHHRHVHKGTYTCDSCGKVFSRRWDLHRHIHRSKMGCRRPNNVANIGNVPHCQEFTVDLNNPPSN